MTDSNHGTSEAVMRNQFKAWAEYMNGAQLMASRTGQTQQRGREPAGTASATKPANGHDTLREVEQLLYRQAECLDGKRWQDFIDLFTDDGTYWMPAAPEQTTRDGVPSIFWEDRDLMTVRLKRLTHPRAWSQKTAWGTNHVIGNVTIEKEDARAATSSSARAST